MDSSCPSGCSLCRTPVPENLVPCILSLSQRVDPVRPLEVGARKQARRLLTPLNGERDRRLFTSLGIRADAALLVLRLIRTRPRSCHKQELDRAKDRPPPPTPHHTPERNLCS
ncbi:hypothetical protein QQF64_033112 [Cirrhinus molitorella]|uniref:Arginine vasopressin-induced protein 1 n=1 Tax=Cirrhinus molitorella TaxID=172907 RepID=A0ABR3MT05_9TELE